MAGVTGGTLAGGALGGLCFVGFVGLVCPLYSFRRLRRRSRAVRRPVPVCCDRVLVVCRLSL